MLFMKGMDLISCCKVLIYFDGPSKRRVIDHFYSNLLPGGYLFLGLSESLFGIENNFRLVHFSQATAYYKPLPEESAAGDSQDPQTADIAGTAGPGTAGKDRTP